MITSKRLSSLDIWSKTSNQSTGTKDIIFITWYKKVIKQRKINH